MQMLDQAIRLKGGLTLTSGVHLAEVDAHYTIYGDIEKNADRIVLVGHGFSCSSRIHEWWPAFLGENGLDLNRYAAICINTLGSCLGSTGPKSIDPATSKPFGLAFPAITIKDIVHHQLATLDALGIKSIKAMVGGSFGGMQAIDYLAIAPERFEQVVIIGACPFSGIALVLGDIECQLARSYAQNPTPESAELYATSRLLAKVSYGSPTDLTTPLPAMRENAKKFAAAFDPSSFILINKAMESFSAEPTLSTPAPAKSPEVMVIACTGDLLTPEPNVRRLWQTLTSKGYRASYSVFETGLGHEGWIVDGERLMPMLVPFLTGDLHA